MNNKFDLQRTLDGEPIETVGREPAEFIAYRPTAKACKQLIVQIENDVRTYYTNGRYHSPTTHCSYDLRMKSAPTKQVDWSKMSINTILNTKDNEKFAFSSLNTSEKLINAFIDGGTSYTCCDEISIHIADITISTVQPWTVWLGGVCPPIPDGLEFEYLTHSYPGEIRVSKKSPNDYCWELEAMYAYRPTGKVLDGWKL